VTRHLRWAGALAAVLFLTGCSDSQPEAGADLVRDTSDDVEFLDCAEDCTGELNGAAYSILLPEQWNGSLLLYSHGYRSASPQPPDFEPVSTAAEPAPGYSGGETGLADELLSQGYALAGSAYASNGWAVEDGVRAADELQAFFAERVAEPRRVYVWGDSLGGLITQEITEQHPEWVDGAAPLCGAHAGVVANLDLGLDLATAVRTLIDPEFEVADYDSVEQAQSEWARAAQRVVAAASDLEGGGTAQVLALGALLDAAPQTKTFDAAGTESRVRGTVEAVLTGLSLSTSGRYDVEQRFGGNVSDNTATDYSTRFSADDRQLIDSVGGPGASEQIIEELAQAPRLAADPAAVAQAHELGGDPSGAVNVPTLTLHTAADPLVLVQNQSYLRDVVTEAAPTDKLVQLFTVPPASYPERAGAPYGAGHCNFTPESRLGMVALLDGWVRSGIYPTAGRIAQTLGSDSGYEQLYEPPPWPATE
jgi:pimeloyl-ACP methyl ester carboxylesterase